MILFIYILSTIVLFQLVEANSLHSYTPTFHDDEHSALLQFKQSFVDNYASYGACSKVSSWKLNSNCCSWNGVKCDVENGRVIGLEITSCLYGSISSNSSLFKLVHLERLNLAYNDFNSSQIPPTIRNLPRLRYLNLSNSGFSSYVPYEVSQLSKLSSLDISTSYDRMFSNRGFLRSLAQNLTCLEILDLSYINISSTVPHTLSNLSHLTSLILYECGLFGEFPGRIFKSQNLKVLDVSNNPALTGFFPADDHNETSQDLISLKLSYTNISINLPSLIERFPSLRELDMSSSNSSEGPILFSLGILRDLNYLDLSYNKFNGQIPAGALANLTQLTHLSLFSNNLLGTIELQRFLNIQKLTFLDLSDNNLELLTESRFSNNATIVLQKFERLGLGECNTREFPNFIRFQDSLRFLDLSGNKLRGRVPKWMWNTSTQTLFVLDVSHNFLSGFDQPPALLPWVNLLILDLSFNMLSGSILIPSLA